MKTKIVYQVALACALLFASSAFADPEEGFYEKNHVRGFISVGGDFRGMMDDFHKYVNNTAFANHSHWDVPEGDTTNVKKEFVGGFRYSKFNDYYLGLHLDIGAQYKQFLTWIDIDFMPTQVSKRPDPYYAAYTEDGDTWVYPLFDVSWFSYGASWMFGWKLFGEDAPINLIPSIGIGFSIINFHLASIFDFEDLDNKGEYVSSRDRYYSTIAATATAELEFRIELGQFAVGGYGGYRYVRYDELHVEDHILTHGVNDTDNTGDTWYIGARITWTFLSQWQKKQEEKL